MRFGAGSLIIQGIPENLNPCHHGAISHSESFIWMYAAGMRERTQVSHFRDNQTEAQISEASHSSIKNAFY